MSDDRQQAAPSGPGEGSGEQPLFAGLNVVVTGGTGFLGSAVVGKLLGAGATCHIPSWDEGELDRFGHRDHPRARIEIGVDLTDAGAVDAFYSRIPELWASIHCAGGFAMGAITELSIEDHRRLMAMNADTCYLCSRAAVTAIRGRKDSEEGGRIVNVAARPAVEPRTGASMVSYTMSKAAVGALTQALAEEVAGEGIWVNAIAPSIIDTPANRDAMPDADHRLWPSVEALAETLVFLASPANRSTRGGIVPVYGAS